MAQWKYPILAVMMLLLLPFPAVSSPGPGNDAGSGRDAPGTNERFTAPELVVYPGIVYEGFFEPLAASWINTMDNFDVYAVYGQEGDEFMIRASSQYSKAGSMCAYLKPGNTETFGGSIANMCEATAPTSSILLKGVLPYTGRYWLDMLQTGGGPVAYSFSFNFGAPAPATLYEKGYRGSDSTIPVTPKPASPADRHVVVAVIDTGINPYHSFFRAPNLTGHPSTWLPGFPESAIELNLSLDSESYEAAVASDAGRWSSVEVSTFAKITDSLPNKTHIYTFPGTRIVGAVSFGLGVGLLDTPPAGAPAILDYNGHGTHSAGLAAGADLDAPDGNVLLFVVQVGDVARGLHWAATQPWIDLITVSIGNIANLPGTWTQYTNSSSAHAPAAATYRAHASGKPVLIASGNGFSGTGLTPDRCTTYTSPFVGPSWVTRIGAANSDNDNPTSWHCVPVEAVARTDVWSPNAGALKMSGRATGTSAATPNAAGQLAHLLLEVRRADINITRAETLGYLLNSSRPVPYSGFHANT
jgi:hypothetical protein